MDPEAVPTFEEETLTGTTPPEDFIEAEEPGAEKWEDEPEVGAVAREVVFKLGPEALATDEVLRVETDTEDDFRLLDREAGIRDEV